MRLPSPIPLLVLTLTPTTIATILPPGFPFSTTSPSMDPHAASTSAAAATISPAPNPLGAQICWTSPECSGTFAALQACYGTIGRLVDLNDRAQSGAFQACACDAESPGDVKDL